MSIFTALILGILIGWLIEWVIDWVYWRRKNEQLSIERRSAEKKIEELTLANNNLVNEHAGLKAAQVIPTAVPDDLKIIKGIGPEIERRLNNSGITTFAQLAELTPQGLENILGEMVKRLASEESLLSQARELAKKE
jgi:predicted flap endonuclease-1-like 5' DNA nuclease